MTGPFDKRKRKRKVQMLIEEMGNGIIERHGSSHAFKVNPRGSSSVRRIHHVAQSPRRNQIIVSCSCIATLCRHIILSVFPYVSNNNNNADLSVLSVSCGLPRFYC